MIRQANYSGFHCLDTPHTLPPAPYTLPSLKYIQPEQDLRYEALNTMHWQQTQELWASVKRGRIAIACIITLILADTCPHPALPAGLIETTLTHIQTTLTDS
ncbi:MAG: hypothetical protein MJA27_20040 [Pseudanabaenales cyanobacterium]|nr:hypothetical protein [Pseudanabaenales cyanobacterium]